MSISLEKNQSISLDKQAPSVQEFLIGLGWDTPADLDTQAFLLGADGKLVPGADTLSNLIFYNNLKSADGAVVHNGDNLTGAGTGDDETIIVNKAKLDPRVEQVVLTVTIHNAAQTGMTFDKVNGAFVRLVDNGTQNEVARYDLTGEAAARGATAVVFARFFKNGAKWEFEAIGQGYAADLGTLVGQFQ